MVKNPPAIAEDTGSIPGSGRYPGERNGYSLQYSWRTPWTESLVGSSPWGCKQPYTTEHAHVSSSLDGGGSALRNPSASCLLNCLQLVQKCFLDPEVLSYLASPFLPWKTAFLPQAITSPLMSNYTLLLTSHS